MFPPFHCPLRGTPSRVRQILLAKLSGSSQLLCYFQKFLARLKAKLITNFSFPLDEASPLHWLKKGGNTKKYQSCFFHVVFCAFVLRNQKIFSICYIFKKWLDFSHSLPFCYYLFIFFLVFIPGITQTRLPAAPQFWKSRPGGGGPSPATPPGPRFHPPSSSSLINGIKYS